MTIHYQSGTWTAALTGDLAVVSSDHRLVLDLWAVLSERGDPVAAVLPRAAGPEDLVVVDASGTEIVVLVRGGLRVTVTGADGRAETVDARGVRTWVERHFPAGCRITVGNVGASAPTLPLQSGVVLVSAVEWHPTTGPAIGPPSAARRPGAPTPPPVGGRAAEKPAAEKPAAAEPLDSQSESGSPVAPKPVAPKPVAPKPVAPKPVAEKSAAGPMPAGPPHGKDTLAGPVEADMEHLFDHTVSRPIEAAAVREDAVPPTPAPDRPALLGDHDGTTITAEHLARLQGVPEVSGPIGTPAPVAASEPRFSATGQEIIVVLSTGREIPLSGPIVIGRQPRVDRWSGPVAPTLVTVPADRESDISRTHLRIERIDGRIVATDLNAANGSVVLRSAGELDLRDGAAVDLSPGDRIAIGDGVTVSLRTSG